MPEGVLVSLRVTPNASVDRIEGLVLRSNGEPVLKLRVGAVPDKGKANAAVVKLLSKAWSVPRSTLSIVAGDKDRNKKLLLKGDPEVHMLMLANWFETLQT